MRNRSNASAVPVVVMALLLLPAVAAAQRATPNDLLVTTAWLAEHLRDQNIVLVWTGSAAPQQVIPGSRALPHDRVMTTSGGHDLPPTSELVATLQKTGISNDSHVVIYGEPMAAGWLFFALDYLGHDHVSLLDGGLEKWKAERRPLDAPTASPSEGRLMPRVRNALKSTATDVQSRNPGGRALVLDARSPEEYAASHIPGARPLEWTNVFIDSSMPVFKTREELAALFAKAGVAPGGSAIAYCAVGLRASVLYFAAKYAGIDASNYVGSWRDWQAKGLPVER
jgi:thiosulfate/3-mercaptopyruvate sulfurtransferase